ncbi:heparan N-sulfatase [Marinifilum sp. JC070]|uniref:Heparan N-sulfatase n=2 Tax=Marinifilum caeruleilacunae TaxID=2499076 RepID=A0ABX1WYT1_9BACT|nr:heparan N-sulfatase [Marinifilum caeruleilacunae]
MIACGEKRLSQKRKRPNILFAIADDQSFPYSSAYGTSGINTPAFDKVANAGVLFNQAFVAAPQCSPSRAAILTGRNIWELEEAGTHGSYFPKKFTVFTDLLEDVGFEIGYTGKPWGPGDYSKAGWTRNPVGPEFNRKKLTEVPADGIHKTDYFGNFVEFYNQKGNDDPFFFWFGCHEPHRVYEDGSGLKSGKLLTEVDVPDFLPDNKLIQSDIADYAVEIEWFDQHLGKMISFLEEQGELENTIIVVTADNGMPFPAAKANLMEYGTHVPLAICWPAKFKGKRITDDLVSLIDLAPTFLEIAEVENVPQMTGESLKDILFSDSQSKINAVREFVLTGRERHTHARPDNLGYPSRAIRTSDYLYVKNFKPERWPAGDPVPESAKQIIPAEGFKELWPGYQDIDPSPSKMHLLHEKDSLSRYFKLAFDKRPMEQLYDIKKDPACINNIANDSTYATIKKELRDLLESELKKQGDPRVLGFGEIFDSYPRTSKMREFKGFNKRGKYNPKFTQKDQQIIE